MTEEAFSTATIDAARDELRKLKTADVTDDFIVHCLRSEQFLKDVEISTLPDGFPRDLKARMRTIRNKNVDWPFEAALGKAAAKQPFGPREQAFKRLSDAEKVRRIKAAARSAGADGRFSKDDIALRAGCSVKLSNRIVNDLLEKVGQKMRVENFWARNSRHNFEHARSQWVSVKHVFQKEDAIHDIALSEDLTEIQERNIESTTKAALISARIGQGRFRTEVLGIWGNSCALTGSETHAAIRASHIKPWRNSTDEVRLDPDNGLPLVASLDALFDAGFISFEPSGKLLISSKLPISERLIFGIDQQSLRRAPRERTAKYLEYHHTHVFKK